MLSIHIVAQSTAPRHPRPIHAEVGFDYAQAVRELNQVWTYEQIAHCMGYESARSVRNIAHAPQDEPVIPSHRAGEALWALYVETFGKRPRLSPQKGKLTAPAMTT